MTKRTIKKLWIWGLVVATAGGLLCSLGFLAALARAGNVTGGFRSPYVPDDAFWAIVGATIVFCVIATGGFGIQLVAWIGAIFNTHELPDTTWFNVLLWVGLLGYLLPALTGGIQLALALADSVLVAVVWIGYPLGGLIAWFVMVCYLIAGPDGKAPRQTQIATTPAPAAALASAR
jgi:hypothetical protein